MKNIFVKATTEPSQVYLVKSTNALWLTSKNPESMEHYGSGTHNQHVYITNKESYVKGDWCIEIETEEVFRVEEVKEFSGIVRSASDTYVYDACVKIVLATDLKLVADGVKEINSEFLEWFCKNSSCEVVDIEAYCPNDCNGCPDKCKNSFYKIISKEEHNYNMKKEILAEMMSQDEELGLYEEPKKIKVMIVGEGMPTKESLQEKVGYTDPQQHINFVNKNIEKFDKQIEFSKKESLNDVILNKERSNLFNSIHSIVKKVSVKSNVEDTMNESMNELSCSYDLEQLFYKWQKETALQEKLDKVVSKEPSKFWKESDERFKNKETPKQVKCYDKFNQLLQEGDYVDVQKDGVQQIYKKQDGELYFKPYGKGYRVSAYFSKDMTKCDAYGNWINNGCYEEIEESKAIEEPNYQQELFNYLHDELDVIALESQLQEIERIVGKMFSKNKYGEKDLETAWCSSEQNMRFVFSSSAYRSITFKKWLESFKNE